MDSQTLLTALRLCMLAVPSNPGEVGHAIEVVKMKTRHSEKRVRPVLAKAIAGCQLDRLEEDEREFLARVMAELAADR